MNEDAIDKYIRMQGEIKELGRAAVAFSGGVDSTLLLKAALDATGGNVVALTAVSPLFPEAELKDAREIAAMLGAEHIVFDFGISAEGISSNPKDRCYHCKKALYMQMQEIADLNNLGALLDGSNASDAGAYRPGSRAIRELGVKTPLMDAGLSKEEIRAMSKSLGLLTWNKPSMACLASRIPYGEAITEANLSMVESAEAYLMGLGLKGFRVRWHPGNAARIEASAEGIKTLFENSSQIYAQLREYGFSFVSADLLGYRAGSMDEL